MGNIKTRFAPSPSGFLHLGNARTALYAWLYARKNKGKFLLRIEDTDKNRSRDIYYQNIIESLSLIGINWDGKPIFQSKRRTEYESIIKFLLKNDFAYKCYCSKERLELLKNQQIKNNLKPKYDRFCSDKKQEKNGKYVVRFKMPQSGITVVNDIIRGKVEFKNEELDDFIIMRSDQNATYNLCVVVDDNYSSITHIIRGD